ncbi:hypothetical protein FBT96_17890 [Rhodobacter capsulatus]|uniref:Transmembrane protein n=1 Tax=Rhodobacter capsulatus TaxID=1061 RepID=A0A4U1JLN7_RHOCA|nr:hypothetical protein [Rhodobacter capsulatus]TKD14548.1 hypothetical protein FBT96_17890 [Rhodobacter capsulatus]
MSLVALSRGLTALGLGLASLAALWWGLAYGPVIETGLMSGAAATRCLAAASYACQFALSICGTEHPFGIQVYTPKLFLGAVSLVTAGLVVSGLRLAFAPQAVSRGQMPPSRAFEGLPPHRKKT